MEPEDPVQPFRLLDLPREIRLMIYEELEVFYNRHNVPLIQGGGGHYGTLINPSIEGIRILQTCRLINEEASYIFQPILTHLSTTPATMIIRSDDLIALTSMGDPDFSHRNILERIQGGVCSSAVLSAIHSYRTGRGSIQKLRAYLRVPKEIDDGLLRAIGSFILRAAQCRIKVNGAESHPPLCIVIALHASFTQPSYTITTSPLMRCWYKYIRRQPRSRSSTVLTTSQRIVQSFAYWTAFVCGANKLTSVSVMFHFASPPDMYFDVPGLQHIMEGAIADGIAASKPHKEYGELKYAGLYDPAAL